MRWSPSDQVLKQAKEARPSYKRRPNGHGKIAIPVPSVLLHNKVLEEDMINKVPNLMMVTDNKVMETKMRASENKAPKDQDKNQHTKIAWMDPNWTQARTTEATPRGTIALWSPFTGN